MPRRFSTVSQRRIGHVNQTVLGAAKQRGTGDGAIVKL